MLRDIYKKIKEVKIQGAVSIALAGLKAYSIEPSDKTIKRLLSLRPTEPCLKNALKYAKKYSPQVALKHFQESEKKIIKYGIKKLKSPVFLHCHSTSVVNVLKEAKKRGKNFQVFNTETRPLYQGRKTAEELAKQGIKVTTIVDAAAKEFLRRSKIMMIGCDAVLSSGDVINKIGSGMFAQIASSLKVKVYVLTDSWKFSNRDVKIEERNFEEIWENFPKHVKIKNPSFEIVKAKHIKAIISELGILKPKKFVKKVKKKYPWI